MYLYGFQVPDFSVFMYFSLFQVPDCSGIYVSFCFRFLIALVFMFPSSFQVLLSVYISFLFQVPDCSSIYVIQVPDDFYIFRFLIVPCSIFTLENPVMDGRDQDQGTENIKLF